MKRDAAFQRRVLRVFEDMLDQPAATRDFWLDSVCSDEREVCEAVRAMAAAASSSKALPTTPPGFGRSGEDEPAPERIGHYRVIQTLGSGGMGIVYLGERDDGLFEHKAAIKVMRRTFFSEQALAHFANERRILARLRHPHIAQMLDGGVQPDGSPFIVMELIDGRPIDEYCNESRFDLAGRMRLFVQAADAIKYAHRNLIVHADIKPSNVVVEDGFGVKLLDFGVARLLDEGEEGGREGYTSGYASPARMEGLPATPVDDVYAMGVLLGVLTRGQPRVDRDLHAIIAKASALDVGVRYGAVSEVVDDLDRWRTHRPVRAAPPGRVHRVRLFWRRHCLVISLSALAVLAMMATLGTISGLYIRSERLRETAENRYTASMHMADYILGSVDPALARASGTLEAREELVAKTGGYLRSLESSREPSPALIREIAAGYLRMAKIEGLDPSGGIGDIPGAEANLRHADKLIVEASKQDPEAPDLLKLRGQARLLGATKIFLEPTASLARGSLTELAEAKSDFKRYLKVRPHDTEAELALWSTQIMPERAYEYLGDYTAGLADIEDHLSFAQMPVHTVTERKERDFITNGSYLLLGEGYSHVNEKKARAYFDTLINKVAVMQQRGNSDWENDLTQTSAFVDRAKLEARHGDSSAALRDDKTAALSLVRLYRAERNKGMAIYLSYVRSQMVALLGKMRLFSEARKISDDNITDLHHLIAEDPSDPFRERILALTLTARASMEEEQGARANACEAARQASIMWRTIYEHHAIVIDDTKPDGPPAKAKRISIRNCQRN